MKKIIKFLEKYAIVFDILYFAFCIFVFISTIEFGVENIELLRITYSDSDLTTMCSFGILIGISFSILFSEHFLDLLLDLIAYPFVCFKKILKKKNNRISEEIKND